MSWGRNIPLPPEEYKTARIAGYRSDVPPETLWEYRDILRDYMTGKTRAYSTGGKILEYRSIRHDHLDVAQRTVDLINARFVELSGGRADLLQDQQALFTEISLKTRADKYKHEADFTGTRMLNNRNLASKTVDIIHMRDSGYTHGDIAKKQHLSKTTVTRLINEWDRNWR